jgi:hypothetical protein
MPLGDGPRTGGASQHDPLVKAAQMRRDKSMRPIARGLENAFQESDGRAFSIGAGHVHRRRQAVVWVAKGFKQTLYAPKRQIDALWVKLLEACKQALGFSRMQDTVLS